MKKQQIVEAWKKLTDEQKANVKNRSAFNAITGAYYSWINAYSFWLAWLSWPFVPFHKLYERVEEEIDGKKKKIKRRNYDIKWAKTQQVLFLKKYVDKDWEQQFWWRGSWRVVALWDIREIEWWKSLSEFKTEWDEKAKYEEYVVEWDTAKKEVKKEIVLPYNDV